MKKKSETEEQYRERMRNYQGDDEVISSHEILVRLSEQPDTLFTVKSNIPSLDRATEGFRPGELIVISGPTKNGKTLLAQTLTMQFAKQQYHSLWFSFEVPIRDFLRQFSDIPTMFMPKHLLPNFIDWFKDKSIESFEKYHSRIIFCDHLHYLIDLAKIKNPSIEIGQVIRQLKTLAVQNEFLIFLLCHTMKATNEAELTYQSIRDSSFVSQESDCVIMIKRHPEEAWNRANITVEFHRRTGVLPTAIKLMKHDGFLVEMETEERLPYKD